jgi:hypothetical protein
MGIFSKSVFVFVTTIADDGKDDGAGWQEAKVSLKFDRWIGLLPEAWYCPVTIGMPLRTAVYGKISPQQAASITAAIANEASTLVMHNPEGIPRGIFCTRFPVMMQKIFSDQYSSLGATAKQ